MLSFPVIFRKLFVISVYVSCTTSPVTHVIEADVNSTSIKGVASLLLDDIGKLSKSAPTRIISIKMNLFYSLNTFHI